MQRSYVFSACTVSVGGSRAAANMPGAAVLSYCGAVGNGARRCLPVAGMGEGEKEYRSWACNSNKATAIFLLALFYLRSRRASASAADGSAAAPGTVDAAWGLLTETVHVEHAPL